MEYAACPLLVAEFQAWASAISMSSLNFQHLNNLDHVLRHNVRRMVARGMLRPSFGTVQQTDPVRFSNMFTLLHNSPGKLMQIVKRSVFHYDRVHDHAMFATASSRFINPNAVPTCL